MCSCYTPSRTREGVKGYGLHLTLSRTPQLELNLRPHQHHRRTMPGGCGSAGAPEVRNVRRGRIGMLPHGGFVLHDGFKSWS
jgi:hypothetical protein